MTIRKFADVAVLLVIGIFVGLIIADASTAEHFVSEWQTMIAGVLAVIAAAWTVGEMRRQDRSQQDRHEELMKLNLRADRLRARRAAIPYSEHLELFADNLMGRIEAFKGVSKTEGPMHKSKVRRVLNHRRQIVKILRGESIVAAKSMFGSEMAFTYQRLERTLCNDEYAPLEAAMHYAEDDMVFPPNYILGICAIAVENIEETISDVRAFAIQLTTLAGHYGPD